MGYRVEYRSDRIDILWCRDSLPEYFTLIHSLLADRPVPEKLWRDVGLHSEEIRKESS